MATRRPKASESAERTEQVLPPLEDGELVSVLEVKVLSKATKPPKPYTEGTLLDDMRNAGKFLEETEFRKVLRQVNGLGTAATRDATIEGLKHDRYVIAQSKYLKPTPKGIALIQWLEQACPILVDVATTARWEAELDVVAQQGGGVAFEKSIVEQVRHAVDALKASPRLNLNPTQKESSLMSEDNGRAPSVKQLEFAERIAEQTGVPLPEEARTSMSACSRFIDENKSKMPSSGSLPPTQKQLEFVKRVAQAAGVAVPEGVLSDARECSRFIDEHKSKLDNSPSPKALDYAESIAKKKGIEIPADARRDRAKLSAFIDANR